MKTKPKTMTVSPTQLSSFADCRRQWYFKWVMRMPETDKGFTILGDVFHSVCERYLKADMQGRDLETKEAVDLFPEGWERTTAGKGEHRREVSITPEEQLLVRKLINEAIEQGFLRREPGLKIEEKFDLELVKIPESGFVVNITGKIDVMDNEGIADHKTVGNWSYALGPKRLAKDLQVLLYACYWCYLKERSGAPMPEKIKVQHNQFGKSVTAPKIKRSIAHVTPEQVYDKWIWAQNTARQMVLTLHADSWDEVDISDNKPGVCNKYGGCPFMGICGGTENVEIYKSRVLRVNGRSLDSEAKSSTNTGDSKMGLFDKRLGKSTVTAPSKPQAEEKPQVKQEAPAQEENDFEAPPWAQADCKACSGRGFNTQGNPCRICDGKSAKAGNLTSSDFFIENVDGQMIWEAKEGVNVGATESPNAKTETKVSEKQEDAPPEKEEPKAKAKKEEAPPKTEKTDAGKRSRGRPKKGYTLLVGCNVAQGLTAGHLIYFEDVLLELGDQLAEEKKEESYFAMNAFSRRDMISQVLPEVAEGWGVKYVVVRCSDAETNHFMPILRSMAGIIIE